ncbi:putative F-box/LRR-repeat protein 23 isoform X2 [Salvia hispanica]|uniref:putative F-box/LRR-repeat protein 23 isoform X2 n=1 Tax=Salvia hispanica TaxID=49212 RepID=UPI0020098FEB|nr:putative F-box/LRR-repeat protein 23 isoform X2 [Salvia hispanica]
MLKRKSEFGMSKAPDSSAAPPWIELPEELTANILQRLHAEQRLGIAQLVCSAWRRACKNPAMWRVIDLDYRRCDDVAEFDIICRCAVDRSQGQLIELKVINLEEYSGFLNYAAERSSQLQCLTLAWYEETETDLTDMMKKLPQLEELHLIRMPSLTPKQFATIGISCPKLKSFTYNQHSYEHPFCPEDEDFEDFCTKHAIAIGKSMPNLRHLRLWELYMRNKGVKAILDGCPHLESLDLRRCSGVDLDEVLFNRCIERIKDLILPTDDLCRPDWSDDGFNDDDGCGVFARSYDFKPY